MAHYEIRTTPGKEVVFPLQKGDERFNITIDEDEVSPRNQDEAKIILARLRAEARAAGESVDFVVSRLNEPGRTTSGGNANGGTSIRLSEENRRSVAKFCGRMMMETGDGITMGDAVARLVAIADKAADTGIIDYKGELNEDNLIALAKSLVKERKAAAA